MKNGDLEMEVGSLERKVTLLNEQLSAAKEGQVVVNVENLEDKSNFANLISRQGTLVENLNNEKKRAQELEEKVQESARQILSNELNSARTGKGVDAATQTTQRDLANANEVIVEATEGTEVI